MKIQKKVSPSKFLGDLTGFHEYEYVVNNTDNLDRLAELHEHRIDHPEADELLVYLCKQVGIDPPNMSYTGRTDWGMYYRRRYTKQYGIERNTIRIRAYKISTEVLIHELTHHWLAVRDITKAHHNWDFVMRLDQLANLTAGYLANRSSELVDFSDSRS